MKQNQVLEYVESHLDEKDSIEMILLKGHLILEQALNEWLRMYIPTEKKLSNLNLTFAKKIDLAVALTKRHDLSSSKIVGRLKRINSIRNKLAHKLEFNLHYDELNAWAIDVVDTPFITMDREQDFKLNLIIAFSSVAHYMVGYMAAVRQDMFLASKQ